MYLDIIRTGSDITIELEEPDDLERFHVSATGLTDIDVQQALADAEAGSLATIPDHCWVAISFVVDRARAIPVGKAWRQSFEGLLAFAAGRGWVDESGTKLLGHIVRP